MKKIKTWAAVAAMLALSGTAQSALIDRGGGMIYDTTANITWLADMNYAFTSGYAANGVEPRFAVGENVIAKDGRMGWTAARDWADSLVYGGYGDWRLPALNPLDTTCSYSYDPGDHFRLQFYGYNCTRGELSHLFALDLGTKANESVLNQGGDTAEQIANLALFTNVQADFYWSGTEYGPDPYEAWRFDAYSGFQRSITKDVALYAVAVRSGDVAATVPEPRTLALALMALGAAMVGRRKRPR